MKTVIYFYESTFIMWRRRLAGIYAIAREEGWQVDPVDLMKQGNDIMRTLECKKPDGIIVEGGALRHQKCSPSDLSGRAAIYCDEDEVTIGGGYFGVRQCSEEVVKKAVRELLMQDFTDYAYVNYFWRRNWTVERERAFLRKLAARGKNTHVFSSWKDSSDTAWYDNVAFDNALLDFVCKLPKPCGILAANDEIALHVLRAAEKANISIPEEITVIGIDNDELLCENTSPTLSSVAPAFEHSGKLAAALLARLFRQPDIKPIVLDFGADSVVRRLSTSKHGRSDMRVARALEFIRTNACSGISASDAVREMGVPIRTAENRFRAVAGHSIRDEIVSVRIEKAKEILANAKIAVNSVYAYCGYKDERSLRYAFTKATGLSPFAWRQRHAHRK